MLKGLWVDSHQYNVVYGIKRSVETYTTDLSGYMMDGTYYRDVVATYMNYEITLAVPLGSESDYGTLFALLRDGATHWFFLPDGSGEFDPTSNPQKGTIQVKGRITGLSDVHVKQETRGSGNSTSKVQIWRACKFNVSDCNPIPVAQSESE